MKSSFIQHFTIFACAIAILCIYQVEAARKDHGSGKAACVAADPDLQIFCDEPQAKLNQIIEDIFADIPLTNPGSKQDNKMATATVATRRQQQRQNLLLRQNGLFSDIKNYFVSYWENLKLIFQGKFGEGIFNQLKNSGSWCEKDNWIVKAVKAGINAVSGGALTSICECLYPMIRDHKSYQDLAADVFKNGLHNVLNGCSDNFKEQIKKALKKSIGVNKIHRDNSDILHTDH
ncbi:hypothetical protein BX616_001608 [Lobosporangium transversale]|uniref:Secreted protein n=1 Tax=Lobosporangium transversale TaxID=64571 RepID=A0A1Y2GYP6_9FUNG|nr:hypothetical protein BCR41DRAFT_346734 [Lobosporangium transversale]KAF9917226.1 hypothetical protein BX616_001608 [Lobosporangium transversale]ORZ27395.1 hypothetical protein BCR41DRAFT_346734 [Lobosporangium transversale]|eukprot:XP_021885122.1 hypothetical protein BCR41DRAFT_346734 [Lobosporangium transversale]